MDNDDFVREPDTIKKEQLITNSNNDHNYSADDELNAVLALSKNEFELFQQKEEQMAFEMIDQIKKDRLKQFETVKHKLNKLCTIDKKNNHVYTNILSIIELYEEGLITVYSLNKEECNVIYTILKSIRLTNEELLSLQKLIIYEE